MDLGGDAVDIGYTAIVSAVAQNVAWAKDCLSGVVCCSTLLSNDSVSWQKVEAKERVLSGTISLVSINHRFELARQVAEFLGNIHCQQSTCFSKNFACGEESGFKI